MKLKLKTRTCYACGEIKLTYHLIGQNPPSYREYFVEVCHECVLAYELTGNIEVWHTSGTKTKTIQIWQNDT
jgi:hypothetical protein